jgi:hypothetical protein
MMSWISLKKKLKIHPEIGCLNQNFIFDKSADSLRKYSEQKKNIFVFFLPLLYNRSELNCSSGL